MTSIGSVDMSGSVVDVVESGTFLSTTAIEAYPVSLSKQWGTREAKIRELIADKMKTQNEVSNIYKELLRAMISSFNNVNYIDSENKVVNIKCIHANAERAVAKLKQENNIILPILSISQTVSDNDDRRRRQSSLLVHEKYWDAEKNRAFRVLSFAPRPVNIKYQIHIWTKYMADMDEILEQIRLKFNPEMLVPTAYSTLTKGYIDSEEDVGEVTAGDKEARVLKKTISVTVRTYIPSPKFLYTSTGKIEKFKVEI